MNQFYFDVIVLEDSKVKVIAKDFETQESIAARVTGNYPQAILKAENAICDLLEEDFDEQWELVKANK